MFVLSKVQDKVEIPSASKNKEESVFEELSRRYANKMIKGLGLGICIKSVEKICYYKVKGSFFIAKVNFVVLTFRFYDDELLSGTVAEQDDKRIEIRLGFYGAVSVPKENFFEEFELGVADMNNKKIFYWFWGYKGHKLYFRNGDTVRFKIKKSKSGVEGRIDEAGLGPLSWWK